MLPRQYRLHQEQAIRAVLRSRRRLASVSFVLSWRSNQLPYCRFGFLVSKKVSAKSSRRNLIKRRLRAGVAKLLPSLTAGYDCLLIARSAAVGKTYQELAGELAAQLERAGLLEKLKN